MDKLDKAVFQLNFAIEAYERHFGKGSLDNVVPFFDPVNPEEHNVNEGTQILRKAIRNNKPLPELKPDAYVIY